MPLKYQCKDCKSVFAKYKQAVQHCEANNHCTGPKARTQQSLVFVPSLGGVHSEEFVEIRDPSTLPGHAAFGRQRTPSPDKRERERLRQQQYDDEEDKHFARQARLAGHDESQVPMDMGSDDEGNGSDDDGSSRHHRSRRSRRRHEHDSGERKGERSRDRRSDRGDRGGDRNKRGGGFVHVQYRTLPWEEVLSGKKPRTARSDEGTAPWADSGDYKGKAGLEKEILEFCKYLEPSAEEIRCRQQIVRDIQALAAQVFNKETTVHLFGSASSDLSSFASDIDLCVNHWDTGRARKRNLRDSALSSLAKAVRRLPWAQDVQCVRRARVPIVKLKHRSCHIEVDLSLEGSGDPTTATVRQMCEAYAPRFRPLALLLKQLLAQQGLDDPYTGGLGSFRLYVMLADTIHRLRYPADGGGAGAGERKQPPAESDTPAADTLLEFLARFSRDSELSNTKSLQLRMKSGDKVDVDFANVFNFKLINHSFDSARLGLDEHLKAGTRLPSLLAAIFDAAKLKELRSRSKNMAAQLVRSLDGGAQQAAAQQRGGKAERKSSASAAAASDSERRSRKDKGKGGSGKDAAENGSGAAAETDVRAWLAAGASASLEGVARWDEDDDGDESELLIEADDEAVSGAAAAASDSSGGLQQPRRTRSRDTEAPGAAGAASEPAGDGSASEADSGSGSGSGSGRGSGRQQQDEYVAAGDDDVGAGDQSDDEGGVGGGLGGFDFLSNLGGATTDLDEVMRRASAASRAQGVRSPKAATGAASPTAGSFPSFAAPAASAAAAASPVPGRGKRSVHDREPKPSDHGNGKVEFKKHRAHHSPAAESGESKDDRRGRKRKRSPSPKRSGEQAASGKRARTAPSEADVGSSNGAGAGSGSGGGSGGSGGSRHKGGSGRSESRGHHLRKQRSHHHRSHRRRSASSSSGSSSDPDSSASRSSASDSSDDSDARSSSRRRHKHRHRRKHRSRSREDSSRSRSSKKHGKSSKKHSSSGRSKKHKHQRAGAAATASGSSRRSASVSASPSGASSGTRSPAVALVDAAPLAGASAPSAGSAAAAAPRFGSPVTVLPRPARPATFPASAGPAVWSIAQPLAPHTVSRFPGAAAASGLR